MHMHMCSRNFVSSGADPPRPRAPDADCGDRQQPCCADAVNPCNGADECINGVCDFIPCGFNNAPCCGGTGCGPDVNCINGTCVQCGGVGQDCCRVQLQACSNNTTCLNELCVACGLAEGQPCCGGGSCDGAGLVCLQNGICTSDIPAPQPPVTPVPGPPPGSAPSPPLTAPAPPTDPPAPRSPIFFFTSSTPATDPPQPPPSLPPPTAQPSPPTTTSPPPTAPPAAPRPTSPMIPAPSTPVNSTPTTSTPSSPDPLPTPVAVTPPATDSTPPADTPGCSGCVGRFGKCAGRGMPAARSCCDPAFQCVRRSATFGQCRNTTDPDAIPDFWDGTIIPCGAGET
eukprot:jgi/Ulvmu1/12509/UM009_0164.1